MDNLFGGMGGGGGEGGGGGGGGDPAQFFRDLPPVSRVLLASTIAITALVNLDVLEREDLDFRTWGDVFVGRGGRVEAWRLLTCFLYAGEFGWHVLIGLHLMNQISTRYETTGPISTRRWTRAPPRRRHRRPPPPPGGEGDGSAPPEEDEEDEEDLTHQSPYHSRGDASDYAFAILLGMIGILLTQTLLIPKLPSAISNDGSRHNFFHRHLKFYVLYVWSKQRSDHVVNLLGVSMSAAYLPYAYLLIGYALNNGESIPVDILHGMFVGHLYYYVACVVPGVSGGRRALLYTPSALVDACDWLGGRRVGPPWVEGGDDMGNGRGEQPALADVDGVIGG